MSSPFVWYDNRSQKQTESVTFYEKLFGWKAAAEGPPGMTLFAGEEGPYAGVSQAEGDVSGWVPYVQVDDLDGATKRASKLGAEILQPRTQGPAGAFTVIRDPGHAKLALWQKA